MDFDEELQRIVEGSERVYKWFCELDNGVEEMLQSCISCACLWSLWRECSSKIAGMQISGYADFVDFILSQVFLIYDRRIKLEDFTY